ncbi:MAG: hypothetical protein JJLCMIEE_02884 [Acidimicrobiales bacterium]|nr:MAG: EAL domain-containing protein [Actinomycetota bacterium]MBV6509785.1 hypothetical protein [Acidimicrobiales bacterium]RIK04385.1 MAG: GGDEF domain-containing protein [Acidobacteriota bacterium]
MAPGDPDPNTLMSLVFEALPFPVVVWRADTDRVEDFRIVAANRAANDSSAVDWDALVGKTVGKVFPNFLEGVPGERFIDVGLRCALEETEARGEQAYGDENIPAGFYRYILTPLGDRMLAQIIEDITARAVHTHVTDEQLRHAFHDSPVGMSVVSLRDGEVGRFVDVNEALCRRLGYSRDEMLALDVVEITHPEDRAHDRLIAEQLGSGSSGGFHYQKRHLRRDGTETWSSITGSVLRDEHGAPIAVMTHIADIDQRLRTQHELAESEARHRALLQAVPDLILRLSAEGEFLDVRRTPGYERFLTVSEAIGKKITEVLPASVAELGMQAIAAALETGELQRIEYDLEFLGAIHHFENRVVPDRSDEVICVIRDITDLKRIEEALREQALTDPLTGLANRSLFIDHTAQALRRLRREAGTVAVLFLDLDRFKLVNDGFGHPLGDELLKAVGQALRAIMRPTDTVARLGGDEFAVLIEDVGDPSDVIDVAERIREAISRPFVLRHSRVEHTTRASASIGLVTTGDPDADPNELLSHADAAMYRAKDRGRDQWAFYNDEMRSTAVRRLLLEEALKKGLENDEFAIDYQPVVELGSGRIVSGEALLRWDHPDLGRLRAADFVDLAEDTGLIVPIGRWVIDNACLAAARWNADRLATHAISVSVNISARQLGRPEIVDTVREALEGAGCTPTNLCLEITETALMDEPEVVEERLRELTSLGIVVSVDDFGTGYSSLSYLKRFPVHALKIDRSFVDGLGTESHDTAIVEATTNLGHILDLAVVAEGVETAEQLVLLRSLGCDYGQGHHIGMPQPLPEFRRLIGLRHRSR